MRRTYSILEVAVILGADELKNPELWVKRRIWAGTFRASRVGRTYRFTEAQLDAALEALESGPLPEQSNVIGLTAASLRRRRGAA